MTERPQREARWLPFVSATVITIGFGVIVVWSARSYGRTVGFAFFINWR